MSARASRAGQLGAVVTVGLAIAVGAVSAVATNGAAGAGPGPAVARPVVLAAILAAPGIVGWLGARSRRASILIAASVASALQAIVAMSGVTLVFVIPALLFLVAVSDGGGRPTSGERPTAPARPEPRRLLRTTVIVMAIAPIAILAVIAGGILGVLALVVIAGAAAVLRRYAAAPTTPSGAILGIAAALLIVSLHVGAAVVLLATSEEVCWVVHADGSVDRIPSTPTLTLGPGDRAGGCASGAFTIEGIALATAAVAGEIAIAGAAAATARPGAGRPPNLDQGVAGV